MSASACVAFYGLRFEVGRDEITGLEARTDSRMVAARTGGLKHFWANFGAPGERYLLFIGSKLGILGPENEMELSFALEALLPLLEVTRDKLRSAGFTAEPSLWLQWEEDV